MHLEIAPGHTEHPLQWRPVAKNFLDGPREKFRIAFEASELRRMFYETKDRVVDQVGGRFAAREEKQLKEAHDICLAQPFAVDFGLHQPCEQVVAGRRTPLSEQA